MLYDLGLGFRGLNTFILVCDGSVSFCTFYKMRRKFQGARSIECAPYRKHANVYSYVHFPLYVLLASFSSNFIAAYMIYPQQ